MTVFIKRKHLLMFGEDIQSLTQEVIGVEGVKEMHAQYGLVNAITIDTKDEAREKGETVKVDLPIQFGDADKLEDGGKAQNSKFKQEQVDVKLTEYFYKQFSFTEKDVLAIRAGIVPKAVSAAITSVVRSTEKKVYDEVYKNIRHYSGDLESINPRDKSDLVKARKVLRTKGMVEEGMQLVMCADTEADLITNMNSGGLSTDETLMREGILGRRLGFDLRNATYAPYHDAGTASENAGLKLKTAAMAGDKVIEITGLNVGETILDGDFIELADGEGYRALGNYTAESTDMSVTLRHELVADVAADVAVNIIASFLVDIALHRTAAVIAYRPLKERKLSGGGFVTTITHPETGVPLTFRNFISEDGRNETWSVDSLFGTKYFDLGRACLLGGH